MRKNVKQALQAFAERRPARFGSISVRYSGDGIWGIYSYETCIVATIGNVRHTPPYGAGRVTTDVILNVTKYSVTTTCQQNSMRVAFSRGRLAIDSNDVLTFMDEDAVAEVDCVWRGTTAAGVLDMARSMGLQHPGLYKSA